MRKRLRVLTVGVVLLLLGLMSWLRGQAAPLQQGQTMTFEQVGSLGGACWSVAVPPGGGNHIYSNDGGFITAINVSDPAVLRRVGGMAVPASEPDEIAFNRAGANTNLLYAAAPGDGLVIVDVSTPTNLTTVSVTALTISGNQIVVSGTLAALTAGSRMQIVNVADPTSPTIQSTLFFTPAGTIRDVALNGVYAYLATANLGLQVVDLHDPAVPAVVGSGYNGPSVPAYGVDVQGNRAYVVFQNRGLHILDVTNLASPTLLGAYRTDNHFGNVVVVGSRAYLGSGASLHILNVSNPASVTQLGLASTAFVDALAVSGSMVYLVNNNDGLYGWDVSNPASPTLRQTYIRPGLALYTRVLSPLLSGAEGPTGVIVDQARLWTVDLTDPTNPIALAYAPLQSQPTGYHIVGKKAYVAEYLNWNGIEVFDLSDRGNPACYTAWSPPVGFQVNTVYPLGDQMMVGNVVAVGGSQGYNGPGVVFAVDISNPASPQPLSDKFFGSAVTDLTASGSTLYVATSETLATVSYADPLNPQIISQVAPPHNTGRISRLASQNGWLYTGGADVDNPYSSRNWLQTWDARNPRNPWPINYLQLYGSILDINIKGDLGVIAGYWGGLYIANGLSYGAPRPLGDYGGGSLAADPFSVGGQHYIANARRSYGLQILRVNYPPAAPTPTGTLPTPTNTVEYPTRTATPIPSSPPTITGTPPTATNTRTPTKTYTATRTPTITRTFTRTATDTHTPTATKTPTDTPTATFTRTPTATATTCVWRELFFEGFEGGFPDAWQVVDPHPEDGEHRWAKRNCRPFSGNYSAWAIGGGQSGAALACGSVYPNAATSWMIFGPFSLDQAERAELTFMRWLNLERGRDQLFYGASVDGVNFYGSYISDDEQMWEQERLDLADVPGLGSLIGRQRAVWIGFAFLSDGLYHKPEGVYIDNVLIRACNLVRSPTPMPTVTGTRLTPPLTPTPTVTCPCIILNPHPYYRVYLPLLLRQYSR